MTRPPNQQSPKSEGDEESLAAIGWRTFVFPALCVGAAAADRLSALWRGEPTALSLVQGVALAGVFGWLLWFGKRQQSQRLAAQRTHFLQACRNLGIRAVAPDRLSERVEAKGKKLRLHKLPGARVRALGEGESLTLAWIETTQATSTEHGRYHSIENLLVGRFECPPGSPQVTGTEGRFVVESCRKSRHADLSLPRRWWRQATEELDWTAEEVVSRVRDQQAT